MNWRALWCRIRGVHRVKHPVLQVYPLPPAYPEFYVLERRCWCGQTAPSVRSITDIHPGQIIRFEDTWDYTENGQ